MDNVAATFAMGVNDPAPTVAGNGPAITPPSRNHQKTAAAEKTRRRPQPLGSYLDAWLRDDWVGQAAANPKMAAIPTAKSVKVEPESGTRPFSKPTPIP